MRDSWYERVAEDARLAQWCHVKAESFAVNHNIENPAEQIVEWLNKKCHIPCQAVTYCQLAIQPPWQHVNYTFSKHGVTSTEGTISPYSFSVWEHPNQNPVIAFVGVEERRKIGLYRFEEESFARAFPVVIPADKIHLSIEHRLHVYRSMVEKRTDLKIALHELPASSVGYFANIMRETNIDWYIKYDQNPPIPHDLKTRNEWHYHLYIAESDLIYAGNEGYERWWAAFVHKTGNNEILYIAARRRIHPHDHNTTAGIWHYETLRIEERLAIAPILMQSIKF